MSNTVKITVKNVDKYFKAFELKEKYKDHLNWWRYIFPREKEMLKYWKYRKCIKNVNGYIPEDRINKEILFFTSEDQFINEIDKFYIWSNEYYLVFEFPEDYPEEDLFYFKLKYC